MNAVPHVQPTATDADLQFCIDAACARIAPSWPLDQFIAVNPHWGRVDLPMEHAAARIEALAGMRLTLPREDFARQWRAGRITAQALRQAADEFDCRMDQAALVAALAHEPEIPQLPTLCEVEALPGNIHGPSWSDLATHQISQFCASHFDTDQADWRADADEPMYASWLAALRNDGNIRRSLGANRFARGTHELPAQPRELVPWALERLGLPRQHWVDYLEALLLRVLGWASWCAYLRWQARLHGDDDEHIAHLLAIRLAWECLLDDQTRGAASGHAAWVSEWAHATARIARARRERVVDWVWQRAMEIDYARDLAARLAGAPQPRSSAIELQAVFCIDVRSEVIRRALEACSDRIQTIGYAGFFGLPMAFTPLGSDAARPQLPGLLAPSLLATQTLGSPSEDAALAALRRKRLMRQARASRLLRLPGAAFGTVEAIGALSAFGLFRGLVGRTQAALPVENEGLPLALACKLQYGITGIDVNARVELAARVLRGMGLTRDFAPVVLIVGHAGQSANNPHAAALDCGACGGNSGEVNARTLVHLLCQPEVHAGLADHGIHVPAGTVFVAALHNTTTDEIPLFDVQGLPAKARAHVERVRTWLDAASAATRSERAPALGLVDEAQEPAGLLQALRERASDWAQTRPEWGLANNAAFIIAPRDRTRGIDLSGRVFLHDYDWQSDTDGSALETLMTAPMLVAHWINLQYLASTVDPHHCGSGNKILHNVVGGRIGVFEGNGGDLRIGLPLQSVHDGVRWMHDPIRLHIVIDAPQAMIDRVIAAHEQVRQLVENRWLWLWRLDADGLEPCVPPGFSQPACAIR
ncbi:MAG: YbcC family protein [Thiomonas sp.]